MATKILTTSMNGVLAPPEVAEAMTVSVLSGNPFAESLTLVPISRSALDFPIVAPSGMDWTAEGAPLPAVDLGEDVYVSRPLKLGGVFDISSEAVNDADSDLTGLLGQGVFQAALSVLDRGLVNGTGVDPQPLGILLAADEIAGAAGTLRAGAHAAVAEVLNAGGLPSVLALNPTDFVAEAGREDTNERPIYPDGFTSLARCAPVPVPVLPAGVGVVLDPMRCMLVQRDPIAIDFDKSAGFRSDTVAVRIRGRFSLAVPVAAQAARRFTIG